MAGLNYCPSLWECILRPLILISLLHLWLRQFEMVRILLHFLDWKGTILLLVMSSIWLNLSHWKIFNTVWIFFKIFINVVKLGIESFCKIAVIIKNCSRGIISLASYIVILQWIFIPWLIWKEQVLLAINVISHLINIFNKVGSKILVIILDQNIRRVPFSGSLSWDTILWISLLLLIFGNYFLNNLRLLEMHITHSACLWKSLSPIWSLKVNSWLLVLWI